METLLVAFKLVLYILGSISLIILIILLMKLVYTIDKTNEIVDKTNEILDDVNSKIKKTDDFFNALTIASSTLTSLGDKIVDKVMHLIGKVGKKKKKNKNEEENYE